METKLEELPEGCISEIISWTSPLDVCRSTILAKLFKSAADSNSVWERFLPLDYQDIISRSTTPSLFFLSKKDLYFSLCHHPILVDLGTKSFRLDRATGKKCYMVGARELSIAWQEEPHYWAWISDPNSRFEEVACLNTVFWFDIKGHIETRLLSPSTTYAAYLVFKFGPHTYGFGELFKSYVTIVGQMELGTAPDQSHFKPVYFRPRISSRRRHRLPNVDQDQSRNQQLPRAREDGWKEIEMGDFTIPSDDDVGIVRMQIKEVEVLNCKSGIIIEGIEVRPK
ncbi:hypothetical protein QQ045_024531 [Rhodiola kirilowii]